MHGGIYEKLKPFYYCFWLRILLAHTLHSKLYFYFKLDKS
uniref:Uncharacterized protein n=1 Tax=Anguilla anguilla TaxID=7936 RepID=A0A0E9U583_ANGAN